MVVFGLDFGTTFCTLSVCCSKEIVLLKQNGYSFIPTTIFLCLDDTVLYGYDADYAHASGWSGFYYKDLKRWVGCTDKNFYTYMDKLKPDYEARLSLVGKGTLKTVELPSLSNTKRYIPLPELIALYTKCIVKDAERAFTLTCTGVICSVPAGYNTIQRAFTEQSISRSGFPCVYMLNEPSAAALASAPMLKSEDKRLLIYDFGGGTFDVSAVTVEGATFVVKSSAGDMNLGGRDIDLALSNFLKKLAKSDYVGELAVTSLKEGLSMAEGKIKYLVPSSNGDVEVVVSTSMLNEICSPFIKRTLKIVEKVREKARFSAEHGAKVVVVGGSSTLPGLCDELNAVHGISGLVRLLDHRAAVSYGCALYAKCLTSASNVLMVDCATSNICLPGTCADCIVVIPSGAPIPFDGERTIHINNASINSYYDARLFEGNYTKAPRNELIYSSRVLLKDLGLNNRQLTTVTVKLHTKIDSVGKITYDITGPSGVRKSVVGLPHYDFSNISVGFGYKIKYLSDTNRNAAALILCVTLDPEARASYSFHKEDYLCEINDAKPLETYRSKYDVASSYRISESRSRMGKAVQKILRGAAVERLPL
ncbi:HSP 70h [Strawberry chlorotic fleck-associated virus]|uniref:HSP 70h n=1 Tax=Strawberry chlorotic fleck-associated virus TaxID=399314 RepID=Q0GK51_9CLOS|nr:HSP 70h [Strawberry chlorotic fleck-associated virus]ABI23185.1 HSP 70h [Strawberry chlorotic fleck-associated virus]QZN83657.1 HSP70h [Strawberry chlorotic fleck-associated virus]